MKRILICLGAGALAIWLGMYLSGRGGNAHRDAPAVAQPPRQSVAASDSGREEAGSKRSPEEAKPIDQAAARRVTRERRKVEFAEQELAKRPELQAALNNNIRRRGVEAFGDLESLLGIDHALAQRIIDLSYEHTLARQDLLIVMKLRGIETDSPEYDAFTHSLGQQSADEMRALVGEEKFELLKIAPLVQEKQIDLATNYAGQFREIDAPLSPDQSLQLAILMARYLREPWVDPIQTTAGPGQYLRQGSEVPLLAEAAKILTPAQLEVVRRRLVEQNMENDFLRRLSEQEFPAD
jgi:hypothetical protein